MTLHMVLYDDVATGHHRGYVAGIAAAAVRAGHDVTVAFPERLPVDGAWRPVMPGGDKSLLFRHRQLGEIVQESRQRDIDLLIDLNLDSNIWTYPSAIRHLPRHVHVVHHAVQYLKGHLPLSARIKNVASSQRLARLSRMGGIVVTHTTRGAEILSEVVPSSHLIIAGYPIERPQPRRSPLPLETRERLQVLFVGGARQEKGLDLLFEAASRLTNHSIQLRVVGSQPDGVREVLTNRHPTVHAEWTTSFVDDTQLKSAYEKADIVALPYRPEFGMHGGQSGVLLEAMSFGLPIVTTKALRPQIPLGYAGSVIAEDNDADSLAAAIRSAAGDLAQLRQRALEEGPPFVAANHTFERYLEALLHSAG